MSGLASRWATDDSLVEQARKQDEKIKNKNPAALESKWSSSMTIEKDKPLQSIWANAPEEPKESKPETVSPSKSIPRGPKAHREKHNNPSSQHENEYRQKAHQDEDRSKSHEHHHHQQHHQQHPQHNKDARTRNSRSDRSHNGGRSHRSKKEEEEVQANGHDEVQEGEGEENEVLPPMSDAAKAFAARLGAPVKTVAHDADIEDEDDDGFVTTDDESDEEEPALPTPPSSSGRKQKTMAERLGQLSVDDNQKKPQKSQPQRTTGPKPRQSTSKYETPSQNRERQIREVKEEEIKQNKLKKEQLDKKAEEEMRQLLESLDSKDLDWASFD